MTDTVYRNNYLKVSINKEFKVIGIECLDACNKVEEHSLSFSYVNTGALTDMVKRIRDYIKLISNWSKHGEDEITKMFSLMTSCWMGKFLIESGVSYNFNGDYIDINNGKVLLFQEYELTDLELKADLETIVAKNIDNLENKEYNYFGLLIELLKDLSVLFLDKREIISGDVVIGNYHLCTGDVVKYEDRYRIVDSIESDIYSDVVIIKFKKDETKYLLSGSEVLKLKSNLDMNKVEMLNNVALAFGI